MSAERPAPSLARLADWVEGRLSAADAAQVAAAVAGDADLQASVAWLQGLLATAAAVPLATPPLLVEQRLRQHFVRWADARAVLERPPALTRAVLVFDSRVDRPLIGVRGDSDDDAFHLAFHADAADLVVDVRVRPDRLVDVTGQVLPVDPDAAPVFEAQARGPGFARRAVDGDDLGRFTLIGLPRETAELRLGNGDLDVVASLDLHPIEPDPIYRDPPET